MSLSKRLFDVVRANLSDLGPRFAQDDLDWDPSEVAHEPEFERASEPPAADPKWYAALGLEPGASLDEIRRAYRRQIRTYHPDRFAGDPEKLEIATEVARRMTDAYNRLVSAHAGGVA